jgi:acetyl-CoA C-acetyltransferase
MNTRDVVISNPVRTAIGAFGGALKEVPATDLGAAAVRETIRRSGLDVGKLASVVMGNVIQAGNRMNPARQASIGGGLSDTCARQNETVRRQICKEWTCEF